MTAVSNTNPLLQPVDYNSQTYFTSHYFHQVYRANSADEGKYEQLATFNRLIRSIETYPNYVDRGDIVELEWKNFKNQTDTENASVKSLIEFNAYNPIMLINATAQVALTHHLDDEISKKTSIRVNEQSAAPQRLHTTVAGSLEDMLNVAKLLGLVGHQATLSADRAVSKLMGVSPLQLLEVELIREDKTTLLTPSDIGKTLGISGSQVNQRLETLGLQSSSRDHRGRLIWTASQKGLEYAELIDTQKRLSSGAPIVQLKWKSTILNLLSS